MERLVSPDGRVMFSLWCEGSLRYALAHDGREVITPSGIGFDLSEPMGCLSLTGVSARSVDEVWEDAFGENARVPDRFNEAVYALTDEFGATLSLTARAYDEGIAFRMTFHRSAGRESIAIVNENTEFTFVADVPAFCTVKAQGPYEKLRISQMTQDVERPLVVELEENALYAAIAEAALVDYARMKLGRDERKPNTVISRLSGKPEYFFKEEAALRDLDERGMVKAVGALPLSTPWRVVMVARSAAELFERKRIIKNLNAPCAIDTAFVAPGKVIRVSPLTTANGRACVDFAVKRGLQYIEVDAGWYGAENSFDSDATRVCVDPARYAGEFDLHNIIAYAREKSVRVILYINQRAMMNQLDELLPLFKRWGVDGVKYGFVEVGSQRWTIWLHECVRKAAAHEIVLTIHDEYRPTGYERTYPNLLTQEGIRGDEELQPATNTLTTVFTRMLCGPGDNTVCYFNPRVDDLWSHAFQLAKSLVIFSPLQFLYWYDNPAGIEDSSEQDFFSAISTVWDETRALDGEIGSHAEIARRKGNDWFLGVMNARGKRELSIPLTFLAPGTVYDAWIYTDDKAVPTRAKVRCEQRSVTRESVVTGVVGAPGGLAARFIARS